MPTACKVAVVLKSRMLVGTCKSSVGTGQSCASPSRLLHLLLSSGAASDGRRPRRAGPCADAQQKVLAPKEAAAEI